jgi:hypothetical protein
VRVAAIPARDAKLKLDFEAACHLARRGNQSLPSSELVVRADREHVDMPGHGERITGEQGTGIRPTV